MSPDSDRRVNALYFTELSIRNFRCFGPEQTLILTDLSGRPAQWTILLGDNGTGKTTLLQTLAGFVSEPDGSGFYAKIPVWYVLEGTREVAAREEIVLKGSVARGVLLTDRSDSFRTHPILVHTEFRDPFRLGDSHVVVNYPPVDDEIATLICYGYGATRRMARPSLSDPRLEDTTASLFADDAFLINAEEWLLQSDYAALSESPVQEQARKRRDDIIEALIKLLPDVSEIRFRPPGLDDWKPGVEVKTPYGWVGIEALSLGYRTLIAWIVDLAYRLFQRYPDSPNPLAEPAVVLVDEIDLHLHPKWQRLLIAYLTERFPNTQFIVTAHSPLIVQAAADANIALLRREGDHVVIDNDVEAIRGWRIDQVLTSDLFGLESARPPEYEELIKERNKILGKSKLTKTDERRLKALDKAIGPLPTGETPEDAQAMEIIRRAAEALKKEGNGAR